MPDDTAVRVTETHISLLFFVGDRVYKLKKPVRFAFADLSSREERRRVCHREVELNRRLAPDVYLGVLDVVDAGGRPVDHLVEMRRLPEARRLAAVVERGGEADPCLRQVARVMAAFHAEAPTDATIARAGEPDAVRTNWRDNVDEMGSFSAVLAGHAKLDRVRRLADRYVDGRRRLFEARAAAGRIRDGHGDLQAEDIFCMDDGPRILDCIEFDDRLRHGDVVADIAFLAMDLEQLGSPEAARSFLRAYREFSSENHPQSLEDHYVAYRALVRSKVACLKHDQGDPDAAERARSLLALCTSRLERARVRLVLVGGLPGTGKSTLAAGIGDRTGWALLRTDEMRKDLAGIGHATPHPHSYGEGIYSAEMTERTYTTLLGRARSLLEMGESVVADASWLRASHRHAAALVARETSSDLVELHCVLPFEAAAERMRARSASGGDASDADERIARAMQAQADPWPGATEIPTVLPAQDGCERALASCGW